LWVIQEILLAPDFRLQCGPYTIDKAYIRTFFQQLEQRLEITSRGYRDSFIGLESMHLLRERKVLRQNMGSSMAHSLVMDPRFTGEESHLIGDATRSILQLCSLYGKASCEDQRDKIFGLLGIASPCCSAAIEVDYSSTLSEVAQAVLLHHIHGHEEGDPSTLENSISLHQSLGITAIDYKLPTRSSSQMPPINERPRANPRITTLADVVDYGPLEYVSPPLDGSAQLKRCHIPDLSLELAGKLQRLMSANNSTWIDKRRLWSRITMHPDLSLPLDDSTDCEVVPPRFVPGRQPQRQDHADPDQSPILFRKLMIEYREALKQISLAKNKRLAFSKYGLAFLVPENVRTGDLTYRFRGRTDLIIVRPPKRKSGVYSPVARSIFNLWSIDPRDDYLASLIDFKLDLYTLQMMSMTSSFPPEQAADEDQNQIEATAGG
jgi:hypothetical protein